MVNRTAGNPDLQFPIGERTVGSEKQSEADPRFDSVTGGELPEASRIVEFD
jgi:hypothetical protein